LLNIYGSDSFFVLEALNHDERNDGKTVTIQAVAFTARNEARLVTSAIFYTDTTRLFKWAQPNNSVGSDCRKLLVLTPKLLTAAQPPGYLAKVFELGQYTEKSDRPNQKATTHV